MADIQFTDYVRDIPDFPKPGIIFKDITPLLRNGPALSALMDAFYSQYKDKHITVVAGIDARGFIFGAALAVMLGVSFVPIRKSGKLPYQTVSRDYCLEYGTDTLEIHRDAISARDRVVVMDDLLATGGTARAATQLIDDLGASIVAFACVIELAFLNGRQQLDDVDIFSIIQY